MKSKKLCLGKTNIYDEMGEAYLAVSAQSKLYRFHKIALELNQFLI